MASWIVHLRLAENLLRRIDGLDEGCFAAGSVAPDSGVPDGNGGYDPPAEISHFQVPGANRRQCADLTFYRRCLEPLAQWAGQPLPFSFLLGYFFHLVTDNLWSREVGAATRARFGDQFASYPELIEQAKRDWYGLDLEYVRSHPDSIFWRTFLQCSYPFDLLDFLPAQAIRQRLEYVKAFYQRADPQIEAWYGSRPGIYLTKDEMDHFIERGTERLFHAFQRLQQPIPETTDVFTALDLG